MFASYGMFASPSGAVATGGDSTMAGFQAANIYTYEICIKVCIYSVLRVIYREAEGRDLNIHCTRRSPTLEIAHSLVELVGSLVLAFVHICLYVLLLLNTRVLIILMIKMKNKASVVAELLKGLPEHREAPLLCLIQALFGLLWRGSYISQVTC